MGTKLENSIGNRYENGRQNENADVENETETVNELSDQPPFLPERKWTERNIFNTEHFHLVAPGKQME